jgi:hypothetical protein
MSDEIPHLYVDVVGYPEENTFVAEGLNIPIVVEAQTMQEIKEKIHTAIKGYFEAFPDEKQSIFNEKRTILTVSIPQ